LWREKSEEGKEVLDKIFLTVLQRRQLILPLFVEGEGGRRESFSRELLTVLQGRQLILPLFVEGEVGIKERGS
jgi:hypothetical protein